VTEALTDDRLLGGRVRLAQPARGYRVAIDTVLLAAAVPARAGERVLDAGCGVGGAALCLAARVPGVTVTGLDADTDLVRIAAANAEENGVTDRVSFHSGDIASPWSVLPRGTFDHAMANPPYLAAGAGRASADGRKAAATVEGGADLVSWIDVCLSAVRARGSVTVVHRADRLEALLAAFAVRAGGIVVFPLWPSDGADAKRVIVTARKGSATPTRLARGLVLHHASGGFTDEAEAILRHGTALDI